MITLKNLKPLDLKTAVEPQRTQGSQRKKTGGNRFTRKVNAAITGLDPKFLFLRFLLFVAIPSVEFGLDCYPVRSVTDHLP